MSHDHNEKSHDYHMTFTHQLEGTRVTLHVMLFHVPLEVAARVTGNRREVVTMAPGLRAEEGDSIIGSLWSQSTEISK